MRKCGVCDEAQEDEAFQFEDKVTGETVTTSMCRGCGRMLATARRKMDERLGSGKIRTVMDDGRYVDLEDYQQWDFIVDMAGDGQWDYAEEGEKDYKGDPLSFTEVDLMKKSMRRIRTIFVRKGFKEVPYYDLEDSAANVYTQFLEDYYSGKPIRKLDGYHWSLCKIEARRKMMEWVENRMAVIPKDILDYAEAHDIPDVNLSNYGERELLDTREKKQERWKRLSVDGLTVHFAEQGIYLSPAQFRSLRGALVGDNKGLKGKGQTKKNIEAALSSISLIDPSAYKNLMGLLS